MPPSLNVEAGAVSAAATVLVLLLGKLYDRKIARDAVDGQAAGRTEDKLWSRVDRLEQDRDRIAKERDSCHEQLSDVNAKLVTMQWQMDQLSSEVERLRARVSAAVSIPVEP